MARLWYSKPLFKGLMSQSKNIYNSPWDSALTTKKSPYALRGNVTNDADFLQELESQHPAQQGPYLRGCDGWRCTYQFLATGARTHEFSKLMLLLCEFFINILFSIKFEASHQSCTHQFKIIKKTLPKIYVQLSYAY